MVQASARRGRVRLRPMARRRQVGEVRSGRAYCCGAARNAERPPVPSGGQSEAGSEFGSDMNESGEIPTLPAAEAALRASEDRYRLASEASGGLIYDWDFSTHIVHRSARLRELTGFEPDEAWSDKRWWQERIHPEDIPRLVE